MTDGEAIKQTVTDYFEGWFEGDATRMERALHPRLAKRGSTGDGDLDEDDDTAQTMIDGTKAGQGTRHPPEKRGIDVEVKDIHGSIASVVVYSQVYREYLHLVRTDDGWKIVNALWNFA